MLLWFNTHSWAFGIRLQPLQPHRAIDASMQSTCCKLLHTQFEFHLLESFVPHHLRPHIWRLHVNQHRWSLESMKNSFKAHLPRVLRQSYVVVVKCNRIHGLAPSSGSAACVWLGFLPFLILLHSAARENVLRRLNNVFRISHARPCSALTARVQT